MNSICLMGRLTADPELKTTQSGISVTSFSVAVDRAYRSKDQERQTDFINCVAWRQTAEFITRYFRKGNRIALQGSLQSRSYTANDGSKRTVYEVVVDNAYFCESKGGQSDAAPSYDSQIPTPSAKPAFSTANAGDFEEILSDEELPF
mgnify:CR=1 FL=1